MLEMYITQAGLIIQGRNHFEARSLLRHGFHVIVFLLCAGGYSC